MKKAIMALTGLFLVIAGIAAGLYCGIWWAFIGGICQIIREIRAPELNEMAIALGIVKVMFAGLIGWFVAIVLILPGAVMLQES